MGPHKIDRKLFDWDEVNNNHFFCGDKKASKEWKIWLDKIRKQGNK